MTPLTPASLVRSLASRFEYTQIFVRDAAGQWEIHSCSRAGAATATPTTDLLAALSWLDERHCTMIGAAIHRALKGAKAWSGRCSSANAANGVEDLEIELTPLDGDAAESCLLTARRVPLAAASDDRHEPWTLAASAAGLGLVVVDRQSREVRLDAAAAGQLGLVASDTVLPVDDWLELLATEDRLRAFALLIETHPDAQKTHSLAVRSERREGRIARTLELSFRGSADGTRWVGASRDVTQERSLEELRRKKLAAERANKAKSEFMSHVSHELRTPLNGVLGFAQLMLLEKDNPLTGEQLKRAEVLMYSGQRLLGLIDQLLEIARIEQGRRSIRVRSVTWPRCCGAPSNSSSRWPSAARSASRSRSRDLSAPPCAPTRRPWSRSWSTWCPTPSSTTGPAARCA